MITFPDPLEEGLRILRASTEPELLAMHFGTESPDTLGDDLPGLPYVSLDLLGTSGHPFHVRASVAITVWAASKKKVLRAAQVVFGTLLDHPGDSRVASITATPRGPFTSNDPDTGQPIASATVTLRLRPL